MLPPDEVPPPGTRPPPAEAGGLALTSPAFRADGPIPTRHTCDGRDLSPALSWEGVPSATQAFALIVDDPDAPRGVFTHWVLFNVPAEARLLPENVPRIERLDQGGVQGRNDFGRIGYNGPCPPPGRPHRYRFVVYALDAAVGLRPGASKHDLLKALEGHVLAHTQLVGTYQRRAR